MRIAIELVMASAMTIGLGGCADDICQEDENVESGCVCDGAMSLWEEIVVPTIDEEPEVVTVCASRMSDEFFVGFPAKWRQGDCLGIEEEVNYDVREKVIVSSHIFTGGWRVRASGISVLVGDVGMNRASISRARIEMTTFTRVGDSGPWDSGGIVLVPWESCL